jgi:hypothetical protein
MLANLYFIYCTNKNSTTVKQREQHILLLVKYMKELWGAKGTTYPHFIYQLHPYSLLLSFPFSPNAVYSRLLFFCLKNNDMLQQKQN